MTGIQRLQRLFSSQRQLLENAAIRQQRKAVCKWENVHFLAPSGAFKCWRGAVSESFPEGAAANAHSASDQNGVPQADHAKRTSDWSIWHDPYFSNSATRMWRSPSAGNVGSGHSEREQEVNADISKGFNSFRAFAQPNATAFIFNSLYSRHLSANLVNRSVRQRPIHKPSSIMRSSQAHQHSLTASGHSHSTSKHSLLSIFSVEGTRAFATESAAEVADILVEHLESDGSDHPTDADLDRALGEPSSQASVTDVVKGPKVSIEATKLFNRVWNQVVTKMGGIESLNIPKEIVWLNGAPGSGKGANTPFILQTRGFPTKAISISSLLQDDKAAQEIMKSGALLSDSHVLELVLEGILRMGFVDSPDEEGDEIPDADEIIAGVVVDGFPRTTMQVDFVKLLHDKLADLHYQHLSSPSEHHFPRPIFRIAVLYVEEEESVRRQLHRGRAALAHNQRVKQSGLGELAEVRETDLDEKAARRRYQIFREHYDTLLRLKSFFPFHLIDAMGTLAQCREQIAEELQYQSGLELGEDTFRAICHLPLAKNLVKQARQNMVTRLDAYMKHDLETFKKVIDIIEHEVIPIVRKCALAGVALYNTERPLFFQHPEASEMLADVLSERGYYVTWQARTREIPVKVDLATGSITCEKRVSLQFRIKFDRPIIRNPTLYPSSDEKA